MTTLLSLIGQQPTPNLLAVRALQPEDNLLVYTTKTEAVARRLRRLISGAPDLDRDLKADPYNFERSLDAMRRALAGQDPVVYNLTGGTKMMMLAAYALAAQTGCPFIYMEDQGRLMRRYHFENNSPVAEEPVILPPLITAADHLNAHLGGFTENGFSCDKNGRLTDGGLFERTVYHALERRLDEVLKGVRPVGGAHPIEIDLVLRSGNSVGIAEVKLSAGEGGKRGLEQLKMAGEAAFQGTYTRQFLITGTPLNAELSRLAKERGVCVIEVPAYREGYALTQRAAGRLADQIKRKLAE